MNEGKVKIAAGLVPLMQWLYSAGVLSVDGYSGRVHVNESFFRSTFNVFQTEEWDEKTDKLSYTFEGVEFFTLVDK